MKGFPDTNVLASAFATRGLCSDLFEVLALEHELFLGEVVLKELRRVGPMEAAPEFEVMS